MNVKRTIAMLVLFLMPLLMLFAIICTLVSLSDVENLPALVLFAPADILLFLLLRWCIHTVRDGSSAALSPQKPDKAGDTIICWDCGGRNPVTNHKPKKCQYCFANLNKPKKNKYL